jgi:DNA mismatch repair protein MutL
MINNKIHLLSEQLIDQIKAGEVIERPSSLIKEILENSIDANSTNIEVHVENSGLELIHIKDNGIGIKYEDLPLAFTRHATSKLKKFQELYQLSSYGFRGEALAVASSISKVQCLSYPEDKKEKAGKICFNGTQQTQHLELDNSSSGTSIYFKDIFYNTPVRLKFIKSIKSEDKEIKKIIDAFLLSNENIQFIFQKDKEEKKIYSISNKLQRVSKVLNLKNNDELKLIEKEYNNHKAVMYYTPSCSKSNINRKQYIFVNKRLILDRSLTSFVLKLFQNFWGIKNYGDYCLFISIPTQSLDVNVHPSKTHVRFEERSVVFSLIKSIVNEITNNQTFSTDNNKNFPYSNSINTSMNQEGELNNKQREANQMELIYNSNNFTILNNFNTSDELQIINHNEFITNYFTNLINKKLYIDSQSLPLIISEPLELNFIIKRNIKEIIEKYSFEIDIINSQKILINAIPNYLESFDYINFFKSFLIFVTEKLEQGEDSNLMFHYLTSIIKRKDYKYLDTKTIQEFAYHIYKKDKTITNPKTINKNTYYQLKSNAIDNILFNYLN